jgi:hypothetical protein
MLEHRYTFCSEWNAVSTFLEGIAKETPATPITPSQASNGSRRGRGGSMRNRILSAAVTVHFLINSASADGLIGGWAIEKRQDPITDTSWVIAQTQESDASGMWLQIRCESKKPFLVLGIANIDFPTNSHVEVVLRIDRSSPTRSMFVGIGEAGALAAALSSQTYSKLVNSKTIAFQATRGGDKWAATFSPTQTPRAMKAVLLACPISSGGGSIPSPFDPKAQPLPR